MSELTATPALHPAGRISTGEPAMRVFQPRNLASWVFLFYLVLGLMNFTHMPFLMAVDKARFRTFVGPATVLTVTAQLEHEGSGYAVTKAKIAVEGKPICDAELRFRIMPFPEGMDGLMRAQGRRIGLIAEAA